MITANDILSVLSYLDPAERRLPLVVAVSSSEISHVKLTYREGNLLLRFVPCDQTPIIRPVHRKNVDVKKKKKQ